MSTDRTPVELEQLPPWTCCGARGPHGEGCRYEGVEEHDELHTSEQVAPVARLPVQGELYPVDVPWVELEEGEALEEVDQEVAVRLPDGKWLGPEGMSSMALTYEPCPGAHRLHGGCERPPGHKGMHRNASGSEVREWRSLTRRDMYRPPNAARVRRELSGVPGVPPAELCGARPQAPGVAATCTRALGHKGPHRLASGRSWYSFGASLRTPHEEQA